MSYCCDPNPYDNRPTGRVLVAGAAGPEGPAGPQGPQGQGLADVLAPGGAALVGYQLAGSTRTVAAKLGETVSVKDFGAVGDGTADDTLPIQSALDWVGAAGGGVVRLPRTNGRYRVTDTIRIPGYTTLEGCAPARYPYNAGNNNSSALLADFSTSNKWIVEAATTRTPAPGQATGARYGYDELVSGNLNSCVPTYNAGLRDLTLTSTGVVPFGGWRMHGAPGATVHNVAAVGVGCGGLLNFSFDCSIRFHSMGLYYGFIMWDDVNASSLEVYSAQDFSTPRSVPDDYRPSFIKALDGTMVAARALSTESHSTRTWGLVAGSTSSLCVNNDLRYTGERYSGGALLINCSGLEATRYYVEGSAGQLDYGLVAATSSFNVRSLHAFMSGSGQLFDLGGGVSGTVTPGGIINPAAFGNGPFFPDGSSLIVHAARPTDLGPVPPRPLTVFHPDKPGAWVPIGATSNSWVAQPGRAAPAYRLNNGVLQFRGALTGGTYGQPAFTLNAGYRPAVNAELAAGQRGTLGVMASGAVVPYPEGASLGLDGLSLSLT